MLNYHHLRTLIIKPALIDLLMYSKEAEELLIYTCTHESMGGFILKQDDGDSLGIYQMKPKLYNDIWINHINKKEDLKLQLIYSFDIFKMPPEDRLIYDLRFASAMTMIQYSRSKEAIPELPNMISILSYYKKYYKAFNH